MSDFHYPKRRQRPPWWPEGEPWPPNRGRRPNHFMGRIALRLGVLFLLGVVACGLVSWAVGFIIGTGPNWHGGPPLTEQWRGGPGFGIFWLLIVVGGLGIFLTVRSLRRVARPVAEVMEAAERVADGDYAVRVAEQGPREMRNLTRSFNSMTER